MTNKLRQVNITSIGGGRCSNYELKLQLHATSTSNPLSRTTTVDCTYNSTVKNLDNDYNFIFQNTTIIKDTTGLGIIDMYHWAGARMMINYSAGPAYATFTMTMEDGRVLVSDSSRYDEGYGHFIVTVNGLKSYTDSGKRCRANFVRG